MYGMCRQLACWSVLRLWKLLSLQSRKSAQNESVRALVSRLNSSYSFSSMVTRMIFTAGALRLFGSRAGMDMSTSNPSTTCPKTL